ncbi:MAG: protein phosphatase 2C domain-containing protein, partial [bacterium]
MNPNINIRFCQRTDIGLVRSENQDSHGKFPPDNDDLSKPKGQLFMVADGLGGHQGGQVASQMAIDVIQKFYFANPSEEINTCLQQAFEEANTQIYHYANTHPNL